MDDERLRLMEAAFVDGFRSASDKLGFLMLAQIPLELDRDGSPGLKLVEVKIEEAYEVGSAHPGFGTHELVYHALPGAMIQHATRLAFVYVSLNERHELPFAEVATP